MSRICALLLLAIIGLAFAQPSPAPSNKNQEQEASDRAQPGGEIQPRLGVPEERTARSNPEAQPPHHSGSNKKDGFLQGWWKRLKGTWVAEVVHASWSTIWTALSAIGTVGAFIFVAWQLGVVRRQALITHPPHIRVNNFAIWVHSDDGSREPPTRLTPGTELRGHVFAINTGANEAIIKRPNFCSVRLLRGRNLPMIRPFDPVNRLPDSAGLLTPTSPGALDAWWLHPEFSADYPDTRREFFVRTEVLRPGEFAFWPVQYTIPENADPDAELYLMGQLNYLTPANTHRATLFCRRYNPALQRFERVDAEYTDYEDEE